MPHKRHASCTCIRRRGHALTPIPVLHYCSVSQAVDADKALLWRWRRCVCRCIGVTRVQIPLAAAGERCSPRLCSLRHGCCCFGALHQLLMDQPSLLDRCSFSSRGAVRSSSCMWVGVHDNMGFSHRASTASRQVTVKEVTHRGCSHGKALPDCAPCLMSCSGSQVLQGTGCL